MTTTTIATTAHKNPLTVLVTNDDGIFAPGIAELARLAKSFGNVTVVAPAEQYSVSSMKLTLNRPLKLSPYDFPVPGVTAYVLDGSPADCVRAAVSYLFRDNKPDLVLSGINCGYNSGTDIAYSATFGAATEAVLRGVPAIALSCDFGHGETTLGTYENGDVPEDYVTARQYLPGILDKLIALPRLDGVWNVNVPTCRPQDCPGVLWDRTVSQFPYVDDVYDVCGRDGDAVFLKPHAVFCKAAEPGTDIDALLHNYVSVGFVKNHLLDGR